jgi:hypothetical protein
MRLLGDPYVVFDDQVHAPEADVTPAVAADRDDLSVAVRREGPRVFLIS